MARNTTEKEKEDTGRAARRQPTTKDTNIYERKM